MFRLACTVGDGIFSRERLVRFRDASGEEYTALVDVALVHNEGDRCWVDVVRAADRGADTLVSIPTADGPRVWVPSESLVDG
jgi:hypothetical protein